MEWMKQEIERGFQQLLCLGLPRQPALDMMAGTVLAWLTALTHNRVWDQDRDTPRIRESFRTMMATRETWPLPKDLVDQMPAPIQHVAIPAKPSDPARAQACIDEIASLFRMKD